MESAARGADALIVVTGWRPFRSPAFDEPKLALKEPMVFDGRNVYDPERMARVGFVYYGIGQGARNRPWVSPSEGQNSWAPPRTVDCR